jgi:nucleoside-diphosphate-sugar epimerase
MKQAELAESILEDCAQVVCDSSLLEPLRGSCVFITGGTGFVGTWLTELILYLNTRHNYGTRVILLSSQASSFRAKAPHLASRPELTLIQRDVRTVSEMPPDVKWVIHAAGNPDNRQHASDPLRVMQVIANGTAAVLEAATRLPDLEGLLNLSSGLVYGPQPWELAGIPEDSFAGLDCSSLTTVYPEAKRYAETLCVAYRNLHRLPIVNARPFAFIGPYQLLDRPWAINNFLRDGLQGGPIRIQGDGETVRSYMYASDMAWWLLRILVQGAVGQSYNVGNPQGVTLARLAEAIAGNFTVRPQVLLGVSSDRHLRRSRFVPNVSLAQNTLGLALTVDLDSSVRRTVLWHQMREKAGRTDREVERAW